MQESGSFTRKLPKTWKAVSETMSQEIALFMSYAESLESTVGFLLGALQISCAVRSSSNLFKCFLVDVLCIKQLSSILRINYIRLTEGLQHEVSEATAVKNFLQ